MSGFENYSASEVLKLVREHMPDNLRHEFYEYRGFIFTENFKTFQEQIENFEVYDDDIWLSSFPKSGTTWAMDMVWSICNDLNSVEANVSIEKRFPFFEYCTLYNFTDSNMTFVSESLEYIKNMPRPRFIKTHLPWDLLPAQIRKFERRPKIIHVARNPKDVAVSFYHHNKIFRGYSGPANLFYRMFLIDKVRFGPFKKNVESYWTRRNQSNILFLTYENMKLDLESVVRQTASFLQVNLIEAKIAPLLKHLSLDEMRKRSKDLNLVATYLQENDLTPDKEGTFVRTGTSGTHKKEMDEETQGMFEHWIKDSVLYKDGLFT